MSRRVMLTAGLIAVAAALVAIPHTVRGQTTGGHQVVTLTDTLPGGVGGVAVDQAGFVYVADFRDRVWRVTPDGEVETFVEGLYGTSGNGIDSQGNLIQANFFGNSLARVDRSGRFEIFAQGLNGPVGVVVGPDDHMVVCNCSGNTLSRVTPDGKVEGYAESPEFNCPNGITRDSQGNHYVVNFSDTKLLKVTPDGVVTHLADLPGGGNGHVTFARGSLWATSFRGNRVYQVSLAGAVTLAAGTGTPGTDDGPAAMSTFRLPNGIATNAQQNRLYVNDYLIRPQGTELVPPAPRSILRQIKLASLTDHVVAALQSGGIEGLTAAYRAWKADPATGGTFTEVEINILGYTLMAQGNLPAALRIFELNAETYPASWNVWDSLAEAHMNAGDTDRAIELYGRSLELNPANTNGEEMLKRLRGS